MAFKFTPSVTVSGGGLKHKVTLTNIKIVGGVKYFHLAKRASARLCQLLSLPATMGGETALSKTDIVEQILQMRNDKFESWYASKMPKPAEISDVFECLDHDKTPRKAKMMLATMPLTTDIQTPAVGDIDSVGIKVLMGNAKMPLYVELSDNVIEYLRDACRYQLDNGDIKRSRKRKLGESNVEDHDEVDTHGSSTAELIEPDADEPSTPPSTTSSTPEPAVQPSSEKSSSCGSLSRGTVFGPLDKWFKAKANA